MMMLRITEEKRHGIFLEHGNSFMDFSEYLKQVNAKAKGKRPYFFEDPAIERVLNITMAVASEVAVLRERIDTIERLLEDNQSISKKEIDDFVPSKSAEEERMRWQAEYVARILRIIHQEVEALENKDLNPDIEEVADNL